MILMRSTMLAILATLTILIVMPGQIVAQATQPVRAGREFERPPHLPIGLERGVRGLPDGRPQFQVPRVPINPALPTLWIIGDSTVRNGSYEDGDNGQWGWGNPIRFYFDESKVNIQNRAVGGTSSLSFQEMHWKWIMDELKPGDFLIMQFGHNDAGTPKGNGDELVERPLPNFGARGGGRGAATAPVAEGTTQPAPQMRSLHTFGWYMRKYVTDAQSKGLKDIVIVSPIPRDNWTADGTIRQDAWTPTCKEAADTSGAKFVDLNGLIIAKYMTLGKEKVVNELFPAGEGTHTSWAGAVVNAECVIEGLKGIDSPLAKYLKPVPPTGLVNQWGKAR
jgi:rhamnogalacturonan acetylesterase